MWPAAFLICPSRLRLRPSRLRVCPSRLRLWPPGEHRRPRREHRGRRGRSDSPLLSRRTHAKVLIRVLGGVPSRITTRCGGYHRARANHARGRAEGITVIGEEKSGREDKRASERGEGEDKSPRGAWGYPRGAWVPKRRYAAERRATQGRAVQRRAAQARRLTVFLPLARLLARSLARSFLTSPDQTAPATVPRWGSGS